MLTYALSDACPQGISFYSTRSGADGNPETSGSFACTIIAYGTGRTLIAFGVGNYSMYINRYLVNIGWGGWRKITATA